MQRLATAIIFLLLCSLPLPHLNAKDASKPAGADANDMDLCSYLKDIEAKTDTDCSQDVLTALRSQNPAAYSQKLELAHKRKTGVLKAYESLKTQPPPAQQTLSGADKQSETAPTQIKPPINERTFPAWLGSEAKDLNEVYTRWLQKQNKELQEETKKPVPLERGKEINAAFSANQTKIDALDKIKDPAQLNCFLGETCSLKSKLSDPLKHVGGMTNGSSHASSEKSATQEVQGVTSPESRSNQPGLGTTLQEAEAFLPGTADDSNLPVKLQVKVRAYKPVPSLTAEAENTPDSRRGDGSLPLWPLGASAGLGVAAYGVHRSRRTWAEQDAEPPEEEDPNSERIQRNWYRLKVVGASAAIGFGIVYGIPRLLGTAGPALIRVARDGTASMQRVVASEVGAVNPISVNSAKTTIWSPGKAGDPARNALGHWNKHKLEFPELRNAKEYVEGAWEFIRSPPPGTLSKASSVRAGETVFYNPTSNTLVIRGIDGAPKSMYRPDTALNKFATNLDYYNAQ